MSSRPRGQDDCAAIRGRQQRAEEGGPVCVALYVTNHLLQPHHDALTNTIIAMQA
jgi:hypothetical protein